MFRVRGLAHRGARPRQADERSCLIEALGCIEADSLDEGKDFWLASRHAPGCRQRMTLIDPMFGL